MQFCDFANKVGCKSKIKQASRGLSAIAKLLVSLRSKLDVSVDDVSCSINPCYNGGRCKETVNSVICVCPPGTSGDRCSNRSKSFDVYIIFTMQCNTIQCSTIALGSPPVSGSGVDKDLRLKAKANTTDLDPKAKAKVKDLGPKAKAKRLGSKAKAKHSRCHR